MRPSCIDAVYALHGLSEHGDDQIQPERVRASRGPALAVLAVGLAVLALLVVVLPRLNAQHPPVDDDRAAQAAETSPPTPLASGPSPEPIVSECVPARVRDAPGTPATRGRPDPRTTARPAQEGPIVVDTTGLINRCEVWPANKGADGLFVTNPSGQDGILEVRWSGSECDHGSTFRFSALQDRYQLVSRPPDVACAEPVAQHSVRLFLSSPVLAASVSADFPRGLGPVPTTLPGE